MTPRYPAEITALVEGLVDVLEGQVSAAACRELVAAARKRNLETTNLARFTGSTVMGHERAVALAESLLTALQEREALLAELESLLDPPEPTVLATLGRRLQELSFRIASIGSDLSRERGLLPQDAPLPELDDAVKAVRAVVAGHGSKELLGPHVAVLEQAHTRYQDQVSLFEESYPNRSEVSQRARRALERYREAVEAVVDFQDGRAALEEAPGLLQDAAIQLNSALHAVNQERRHGLSDVPALDAFGRAARDGKTGMEPHFARLEAFLAAQRGDCQRVCDSTPLMGVALTTWETSVRELLDRFQATLEEARSEPNSERKLMELFRLGQELINRKNAWIKKASQSRSLAADPLLDDLRSAAAGWYARHVPRPFLLGKLEQAYHAAVDLDREIAGLQIPEQADLAAAVRQMLTALDQLRLAVDRRDRGLVSPALHELESAFDRWVWCRETVALLQQDRERVTCLQCGWKNLRVRVCAGCGGFLAWPEDGSSEAPSQPVGLAGKLAAALESEQRLEAVRPLLARCHETVKVALRRLAAWRQTHAHEAERFASLEPVASDFEQRLLGLEAALARLLSQADGDLQQHAEALEQVRELLLLLGETPADPLEFTG